MGEESLMQEQNSLFDQGLKAKKSLDDLDSGRSTNIVDKIQSTNLFSARNTPPPLKKPNFKPKLSLDGLQEMLGNSP